MEVSLTEATRDVGWRVVVKCTHKEARLIQDRIDEDGAEALSRFAEVVGNEVLTLFAEVVIQLAKKGE